MFGKLPFSQFTVSYRARRILVRIIDLIGVHVDTYLGTSTWKTWTRELALPPGVRKRLPAYSGERDSVTVTQTNAASVSVKFHDMN